MIKAFLFDDVKMFGERTGDEITIKNSFEIEIKRAGIDSSVLVSSVAKYSGESAPKVYFSLWVDGDDKPLYQSYGYSIGRNSEFEMQQWRIPPMFRPDMTTRISIIIPDGTVLKICDMSGVYDDSFQDWNGAGARHNAHLGFYGIAPNNTMPAFELAARCGFPACIVVPKVTANGVIVCIHNDTINATARDENGNPPTEPINVSDYTYAQLLKWEFGSWKHRIYKGTHLPRLEEFFELCAKTGMRPMFSTHPALSVEKWEEVKMMLTKYGLLKKFHIKSFELDILKTAYSVFGDTIDGYTYDLDVWSDTKIDEMLSIGIDGEKCRIGMELANKAYTEAIAKKIINAGMFSAMWNIPHTTTSEDYERFLSYGITEFTEDYHCSMGLNW